MERGGQGVEGRLTAERHEGKQEKGVTFPPRGAHMDMAVLWQEGHPRHPGVLQPTPHPQKPAGLEGMPWITVLLLIPPVLQDQANISGTTNAWVTPGNPPAICFSLVKRSCNRRNHTPLH